MKRLTLVICTAMIVVLTLGIYSLANASYISVGPNTGGPLTLSLDSYNFYYVDTYNYRVKKQTWTVSNPTSESYTDVRFVLPFVWGAFQNAAPLRQAYAWDNVNQEWINDYVPSGNDGVLDNVYVKVYSDPDSASFAYMPISQTDIPLSWDPGASYETASVLSTDSMLYWEVASVLNPGDSVQFSTFWEYERRSASPYLSGLWEEPFVVATPLPAAVWLLGSGLIGLAGFRRRLRK